MTCLKACPHRSVEVNLRPPGIELWTTHTPRTSEVALLLLLLGGVFLHRLPELQSKLGLSVDLTQFWPHLGFSLAALILPAGIPFAGWGLMQLFYRWGAGTQNCIKPRPFVELAYGYLPLVLGATLAHYLPLGLGEAGRILPVSLATFGVGNIGAVQGLPVLVAHPAVISFLQGATLILSALLTVVLTQKIARCPVRLLLSQHLAAAVLAGIFWAIMV